MEEKNVADNETQSVENTEEVVEVATPQEQGEQKTEVQSQNVQTEQTETQRVAQRIKEATEKAKQETYQEARDKLIAEQDYVWNGKPITTEKEYKDALKEQEIIESLKNKDLPQEVIDELVESRKFRERDESERRQKQEQEKKQKEYLEFLEDFPDVKPDEIPAEVWETVNKGKTLSDAYARYENKTLKEKQKALEQNEVNKQATTGSVTGKGAVTDDYISEKTFESNKTNPDWVKQNYSKIMESRAKW